MSKPLFFIILSLLAFSWASAQKVEVHASKDVDLSGYRSFYTMPGEIVLVMNKEVPREELKESVRKALVGTLAEKNYQHTKDSASADLAITFVAEVVERLEQQQLGPLGQTPASSGADLNRSDTWTQEIRSGSLAIEVVDRSTGKTLWRSTTSINFRSFDLNQALQAAVARGLRKFPKAKK